MVLLYWGDIMNWFQKLITPSDNGKKQKRFSTLFNLSNAFRYHASVDVAASQVAVAAAVRILAQSVSSLPLEIFKRSNNTKVLATNHALYNILHNAPNDFMTSMEFRELMMNDLLYGGNFYALIKRDKVMDVSALIPIDARCVQIGYAEGQAISPSYWVNGVPVPNSEILHLKLNSRDGIRGYSLIEQHRSALQGMADTEAYAAKFYENGARLSGVLEVDGVLEDEDVFNRMRESFQNLYGGVENAYKVALLEAGVKYKPISITPKDSQYIEQRKLQIADVSRMFNVPLHLLSEMDRATFSNIEHQSIEFVMFSLRPHLVRIEQSLMRQLLTTNERKVYLIEHNIDALLRGDAISRFNVYQIARQNGIMTANEIRSRENMPAIDGGDEMLVNGALYPVSSIDEKGGKSNDNKTTDVEGDTNV